MIEVVFLRRFANVLAKALSLYDKPDGAAVDTNVKVRMSAADVRAVVEFAAGGRHPADFDAVTSTMMAYTFPDKWESPINLPAVDEDLALRAVVAACFVYWCYMYSQVGVLFSLFQWATYIPHTMAEPYVPPWTTEHLPSYSLFTLLLFLSLPACAWRYFGIDHYLREEVSYPLRFQRKKCRCLSHHERGENKPGVGCVSRCLRQQRAVGKERRNKHGVFFCVISRQHP